MNYLFAQLHNGPLKLPRLSKLYDLACRYCTDVRSASSYNDLLGDLASDVREAEVSSGIVVG